jgi:MFS transporter, ACS family, solute carrier family 17 (sodium-dependent inorganic phosphate cotransporter), other
MGNGSGLAPSTPAAAAPLPWLGQRHVLVLLVFLACVLGYTDRVNIAVVAVAMKEQYGWSQTDKGIVLSAFFAGYLLFMPVTGFLAARLGGRRVLGWSVIAWSAFTLLTPLSASVSFATLVATRVLMGMGEAAMFPAAYELFGRWVPLAERSRATARLISGIPVGTLVGLSGSGWLVRSYGWPAAFYVFGALGLGWALVWFLRVADDPAVDRRLTEAERSLLAASVAPAAAAATPALYRRLLLSLPTLALCTAHFATTWNVYVLISWLPSYFREVQHLTIAGAGLYAAAPWLAMFVAANLAAALSDRLVARGARVTRVRKFFECSGLVVSALMLLLTREATSADAAVACLCVAMAATGWATAGFAPGVLDVAPRHSGVLYSFSNTFATIPGVVGVAIAGWLVDVTGTYSSVFALAAGVGLGGALLFGIFFDARPVLGDERW